MENKNIQLHVYYFITYVVYMYDKNKQLQIYNDSSILV